MNRSKKLINFLETLCELPDFENTDFSDINATNYEGDNALHLAILRDEYEIAEELIELGINIDARGDLGRTPLHGAASTGKMQFVMLLVENGADLFALNEGYPPFTLARFSKNDAICDYLAIKMKEYQEKDATVYIKAKIKYLEREIDRLNKILK
ncbi:ankyrin repeat domain-containing protein [Methylovulum psychrotolerans]|uniref:Actin-binding protein n=1 Tax=Methylovulum psychrotolerans TaxID=1704499 RepID=A0A2S5CMP3_9GAMM|nr:ankyrin repeat domain-containing protein [Methylovulum psychrotolerans]POZ52027.1 Actin-binding protein [Methylovulum psychrotolerans]